VSTPAIVSMQLRDMTAADLDAVLSIEQDVHAHPWTRGNFSDALESGYVCRVYEVAGKMHGFVVLMAAVDEMHLLDISIAAAQQRQGLGRSLLDAAKQLARGMNMQRMLLEVRPSNSAAIALYARAGFAEIGRRRGYYPAAPGVTREAGNAREDAIVMECKL
jgi:[ribosomal protein S18]-alanine N-acetyltransferase